MVAQIPPELHTIARTCGKLLAQIGYEWVELTAHLWATRTFGKYIGDQKAAHGLTPDLKPVCDSADAQPLCS
jgi:hypothetical protein